MTGVRFSAANGWEGLCAKQDGGCGEWWPLDNTCWSIMNTIKRCRSCYNATQREPGEKAKHAAYMRRFRQRNPDAVRQYQQRYRETHRAAMNARRVEQAQAQRERRAAMRALICEGLDAA